jgi:outer membrane lipoprotein SlyB
MIAGAVIDSVAGALAGAVMGSESSKQAAHTRSIPS